MAGGKAVEILESALAISVFTIKWPRDELDKGKAAVQVRLQSPALGAGFYLLSPLGTQHAALLASTVCGANILSTVCVEPLLVFLFEFFFLTPLCCKSQRFSCVTSGYAKLRTKSWTLSLHWKDEVNPAPSKNLVNIWLATRQHSWTGRVNA